MQVRQRLDALTSLRFIAAAMIVLGHADSIFGSFGVANAAPLGQGVSFFFVLSGFILTWNYPVLVDWSDRKKFWLARFARIWPLHLVTCLLWIALIFNFDRASYFPRVEGLAKLALNLTLLQVWVPLHDWALSFNGVAWSISTEFFFYAMFPLLIALWHKRWHQVILVQAAIILIVIGFATAYSLPSQDDYPKVGLLGLIYFNPLVRIFEFSIGISVALLVRKIASSRLELTVLQWLVLELAILMVVVISMLVAANSSGIQQTLGSPAAYYFTKEGLWLIWALLIGVFALSHGPLTHLLSMRFAVFLGEISFALYLCHALVVHYLENYIEQVQPYGLLGYAAFWAWCLTFAAILFIGVETPSRKFILAAASKKGIASSLRASFRTKEIVALTLLMCMAGAMFFLRPSTIVKLNQANVTTFMQPSTEDLGIPRGVIFDDRYEVMAMHIHAENSETVQVHVLLHATQKLWARDVLALHINDKNGNMITNADRRLDFGRTSIPEGTYWIQRFKISKVKLDQAASIGLAMYNKPSALFDGVGGTRDWGGKRLIVPLNQSGIVKLDQASVAAFVHLTSENVAIPQGVRFDNRYEIVAMRVHKNNADAAQIEVLLHAPQELFAHDVLALHINDKNGNMIVNDDRCLDAGRTAIPAGTYWIQQFSIPKAQLNQASTFGLAMYNTPSAVFDVVGGDRDWGGKRLILPFKR